jgi:hypothetical protein
MIIADTGFWLALANRWKRHEPFQNLLLPDGSAEA